MSEAGSAPYSRQEALRVLLRRVVVGLGLDVQVKIRETEEVLRAILAGRDARVFGLRQGAPLRGLQHLVERILSRDTRFDRVPIVEIEGQREELDLELKKKALQAAEQVRRTGEPVQLPPLNPYERRIVHLALRDEQGVSTRSTGDGPHRRLGIYPGGDEEGSGPGGGGPEEPEPREEE